jgi:hypothetical protein
MTSPDAAGQRFLATGEFIPMAEMARVLRVSALDGEARPDGGDPRVDVPVGGGDIERRGPGRSYPRYDAPAAAKLTEVTEASWQGRRGPADGTSSRMEGRIINPPAGQPFLLMIRSSWTFTRVLGMDVGLRNRWNSAVHASWCRRPESLANAVH